MKTSVGGQPVLTVNEARDEFMGLGPVEGGDTLMAPTTMAPVGEPQNDDGDVAPQAENDPNSKAVRKDIGLNGRKAANGLRVAFRPARTKLQKLAKRREELRTSLAEKIKADLTKRLDFASKKFVSTKEQDETRWKEWSEYVHAAEKDISETVQKINDDSGRSAALATSRCSLIPAATRLPTSDPRQCPRRRLLRPKGTDIMLNQPMMEKLLAMRLQGMVEALKTQEQDRAVNELSFLERLALLVDQQWSWRENQALARRLKAAKLRGPACVEDIDYRAARGLDKTVVRALAKDSSWVRQHENIFVLGPTGVGKSFIASALAQKACRDRHSALYLRTAALLRELALARAAGSLRNFLARLGRIDVLVIDDWAMAPLNEAERREVWEICEDRYQTRSTVLTSQLPVSRWHEQIGDPTIADGILDRLVHNAHGIEMRGESMRKKHNPPQDEKKE